MIRQERGSSAVWGLAFSSTYHCVLSVPQTRKQIPKANWSRSNAHHSKYEQHNSIQGTTQPLTHSSLSSSSISNNFCLSPSLSPKAGNLQKSTDVFGRDIHTEVFLGLKNIFKYFYFSKKQFCSERMDYRNGWKWITFDILPWYQVKRIITWKVPADSTHRYLWGNDNFRFLFLTVWGWEENTYKTPVN